MAKAMQIVFLVRSAVALGFIFHLGEGRHRPAVPQISLRRDRDLDNPDRYSSEQRQWIVENIGDVSVTIMVANIDGNVPGIVTPRTVLSHGHATISSDKVTSNGSYIDLYTDRGNVRWHEDGWNELEPLSSKRPVTEPP